jgi:hypothetical protein
LKNEAIAEKESAFPREKRHYPRRNGNLSAEKGY